MSPGIIFDLCVGLQIKVVGCRRDNHLRPQTIRARGNSFIFEAQPPRATFRVTCCQSPDGVSEKHFYHQARVKPRLRRFAGVRAASRLL